MAKKDKKDKKLKKDKAVKKVETSKAVKKSSSGSDSPASTRVITQPCRSSYMFVNESREDDDGNQVFSTQVIIPKKDKITLGKFEKAIKLAAQKKFGVKVKLGQLKLPLRDAEEEDREGSEYKNSFFLNAKSFRKPGAVDRANNKIIGDECSELLYSGAHFRFSLTFYGFEARGSKGVAVALNNVMFHKHDDRLDGGVDAEDEFEDYGEGDEFDD